MLSLPEILKILFAVFSPLLVLAVVMALLMAVSARVVALRKKIIFFILPVLSATGSMVILIWMMGQRVGYAYELEWIEGGIFQQVVRILEGYSPYGKPDFDYVPALYAPLYYYISAVFSYLFGAGLPALRAVSVIASLLTAATIALTVRQLTKSKFATVLGFIAYSTMYLHAGYWFDVARVDSLWTMWLGFTVYFLIRYYSIGRTALLLCASCCYALSVLTKQTSLFVAPSIFLTIWLWRDLRGAAIFSICTAAQVLLACLLLQWHSDGWFSYFTIEMAPSHGVQLGKWKIFFWQDTIYNALFIAGFSLLFIGVVSEKNRIRLGWVFLLAGFSGMSMLSRMYTGGEANTLMPYYMLLTVMSVSYFGLMVDKFWVSRATFVACLSVVLGFNYYHGWVTEAAEYRVPNRRLNGDDAIGNALVRKIAQVPGRVCVTMHGYLAYMAGKDFCAHRLLLQDVMMSKNDGLIAALKKDGQEKIMSGYYQVIIIDDYAEIQALGIKMQDIPYTMTLLENDPEYPRYEFYPIVSGTKPQYWLEYNGSAFVDNSARSVVVEAEK